ncbi:flagellar hook-associated protein 2 [Paenibacillus amylolyticus]|uniref:Flagellar hook-associated protein 2 n=1 Tax=Paenibacillus amylolyticus TaxID=1451 RepID=A0AAP5H674_PAEAM|nr:flagellar filament capping protein FliD [Paenibacillus amylolyticus]MDR6726542.1 flagellar hook-associated protein 2 [Paenibacillus amylolyticus]
MRINGFSGMDIDSMVKSMMTAQRVPLDKLNQKKTVLEWTRDSYRELNNKMFTFKNAKLKDQFGMSAALNSYKAVVTGNMDAVRATATANANGVTMNVEVEKLATQAKMETQGAGTVIKSSTTLEDLQKKSGIATPSDKYELYVNGVNISLDKKLSISEVVTRINSNADAKATAKFDEITGKLTLLSKDYGDKAKLDVVNDASAGKASTLLDVFGGISSEIDPITNESVNKSTGSNAKIKINNNSIADVESNVLTINGITLTLNAITEPGKPTIISTQNDTTKALETIKSFVNDYNELLATLNSKVNETRYRDFPPLTDEQKKEMTENDIKLWEEKAKSGLFKDDGILKTTISDMRMEIMGRLKGLSAAGITTGQYFENGKLYIDEKKLQEALEKNPQEIIDLLQGPSSAPTTGLFDKLQEVMEKGMGSLADKAGTSKFDGSLTATFKTESSMGRQLKEFNKQILNLRERLANMENRYYKQFTAMETAMTKYQSQSASLLSSLGMTS